MTDPFRHHPGLRDKIADPETSSFRTLDLDEIRAHFRATGLDEGWLTPQEVREAGRRALLAGRTGDLWVFAYGSLMWDPALRFAEVRRARVEGLARRFILKDTNGGRGDRDRPGLMVALADAPGLGCDGLAFRIPAPAVEEETRILWRRERIGSAYREAMVVAETDAGPVEAATFVADPAAPSICPDLGFDEQVRYIATGRGRLGTSLDYLRGIARHFAALEIADPEVEQLLAAAEALAAKDPP